MSQKKQENRGGKREGAGRKPIHEVSDRERREIIKFVKKECQLNNTNIGQELGKIICGQNVREKMAAISLYAKDILSKSSERDVNHNAVITPQVFVPESFPDTDEAPSYEPTKH